MESLLSNECYKKEFEVGMTLGYLYSKFFKKVLRGVSILNSEIDKTAKVYSGSIFYDSSLGRYSYVGYDSEVVNCEIGAFCSIANGFIAGGARHPLAWVSTSPVFYNVGGGTGHHLGRLPISNTAKTIIESDVWIGSRVIIMQGIRVGIGAVIGAGAVVTKDVPPYAIVVGCPARIIKYRFDDDTIKSLLKSQWWLMPDEILNKVAIYMNDPSLFICEVEKINRGGEYRDLVLTFGSAAFLSPYNGRNAA